MRSRGLSAFFILLVTCLSVLPAASPAQTVTAHVFWQEGCPHCARARAALDGLAAEIDGLEIAPVEIGVSDENDALFDALLAHFKVPRGGVPFVVVGGDYRMGFAPGGLSEGEYRLMITRCRAVPCRDVVAELRAAAGAGEAAEAQAAPGSDAAGSYAGGTLTLPLVGEVALDSLSLPLLTLVLAAVDGFNPCAMWVLVLLIGLLLGVEEGRRMWTLGAVFLLATAAMYFAVMAAWLNVVLWLGAVGWIRLAIGALAIGAGGYYLREFWTNPEGACKVTGAARKRRFSEAFKVMVAQPSLVLAALGVAALAIAVNLVELACSAGLPAIYTQVLAMHDLPSSAHYLYLLAYLAIFLFDDTLLFVIAMVTLRATMATGRYARVSHLVGGVVLLALGAVMVLRPDLLG